MEDKDEKPIDENFGILLAAVGQVNSAVQYLALFSQFICDYAEEKESDDEMKSILSGFKSGLVDVEAASKTADALLKRTYKRWGGREVGDNEEKR